VPFAAGGMIGASLVAKAVTSPHQGRLHFAIE
jgi:hypothetical protein